MTKQLALTIGRPAAPAEARFGIDPHPMRSKIHYVRHVLGYAVERRGGRYHGMPPEDKKAAKPEPRS